MRLRLTNHCVPGRLVLECARSAATFTYVVGIGIWKATIEIIYVQYFEDICASQSQARKFVLLFKWNLVCVFRSCLCDIKAVILNFLNCAYNLKLYVYTLTKYLNQNYLRVLKFGHHVDNLIASFTFFSPKKEYATNVLFLRLSCFSTTLNLKSLEAQEKFIQISCKCFTFI